MTIIAFTGHRPKYLGAENSTNPRYVYVLQQLEEKLIELKPDRCITGMALGVDSWAAELCIKLNIPFIAAIPFVGQEKIWNKYQQQKYSELLESALDIFIISEGGYVAWKMQKRNQYMVDNCNILLAVFDGTPGGTANCINYAKQIHKKIITINPNNF